jgi:hypothetical protein
MFSGLWEKSAISIAAGVAIGLMDSIGFFITAKFFLANAKTKKRINALFFEVGRLIVLIGVIFLVCSFRGVSSLWLLGSAILVSLLGKLYFIAQRFKA